MPKLTSGRRVPSDDCTVDIDGQDLAIHEDEWVELLDVRSTGERETLDTYFRLGIELEAAKGEPDERQRIAALRADAMGAAIVYLAKRILRWNWTDALGRPFAEWNDRDVNPETGEDRGPCLRLEGRVEILRELAPDEIGYLIYAHLKRNLAF